MARALERQLLVERVTPRDQLDDLGLDSRGDVGVVAVLRVDEDAVVQLRSIKVVVDIDAMQQRQASKLGGADTVESSRDGAMVSGVAAAATAADAACWGDAPICSFAPFFSIV